ncbi:uncharacterized protein SPPG_09357 [Spizellomyces punctatus DAOM BR117]|uniref:Uncharacterized protein n=1 Tax=Spizellomyces punctatus (strain DAOM BR117) TaxID=645134 RepID=A0A0L0HAB9_SPIPD|nr:uncharacterized protein SPPG_09357 [Spizellomyces punctatus DAOM BR117]KNC98515.1 hypothetical protein SPPG_09357 [Spizellomyces punctatus DAOM BR117]|eukprot:XP_016606555.1 hypothetical protein SPPG_09357 [Spizellomyces punctatus DAOM BR117]
MTNDPTLLSDLSTLLTTLKDIDLHSNDVSCLDGLDIAGLGRQMDSANAVLDQLESRTDALMQKIDALLEEGQENQEDGKTMDSEVSKEETIEPGKPST